MKQDTSDERQAGEAGAGKAVVEAVELASGEVDGESINAFLITLESKLHLV